MLNLHDRLHQHVHVKYNHPMPTKRQLSPHKHRKIVYGQLTQLTHNEPYSPPLSAEGIKRIQGIISALLYYAGAVDNKLLATLSTLSSQQATATEATAKAIDQLLDYLATYPDDGATYRSSDMILCAHAEAGFHNESKGRSCTGAHIFMSKNDPFPRHNGPVLSISQIMKFIMSSAAKAELGALYTAAKEWPLSNRPSTKWVGHNPALQSRQTTPLRLASPTTPSYHRKPSPWISAYDGSDAVNPKNNFATTRKKAAAILPTTTPNTTCPSTTNSTDTHMQAQQPNNCGTQ
jgi:hypothetical protein